MTKFSSIFAISLAALTGLAFAEVEPKAHYNLHGQGGIRDTAAPPTLKSLVPGAPELTGQGSPKIMSDGPAIRRQEYDSSIQFINPGQCYSAPKNLADGENFLLEAWAYPLKANDSGYHAVVANGDGASGFLLGQKDGQWMVLVGGVGDTVFGKVEANQWTHLAIVKNAGAASVWVNGEKMAELPGLGGGRPNFSIGATQPTKEPFNGWISEVRVATFKPGKFDPAEDFLMDTETKQHA